MILPVFKMKTIVLTDTIYYSARDIKEIDLIFVDDFEFESYTFTVRLKEGGSSKVLFLTASNYQRQIDKFIVNFDFLYKLNDNLSPYSDQEYDLLEIKKALVIKCKNYFD